MVLFTEEREGAVLITFLRKVKRKLKMPSCSTVRACLACVMAMPATSPSKSTAFDCLLVGVDVEMEMGGVWLRRPPNQMKL